MVETSSGVKWSGRASRIRLAKAEKIAVRIFDVKIHARPWSLFQRPDHLHATRLNFLEQISHPGDGDVRVQMFVLLPMFSLGGQLRPILKMDCESIA